MVKRIAPRQYKLYMDYVERHPEIRCGAGEPQRVSALWQQLADELNAFGVGLVQPADAWRESFAEWRLMSQLKAHDKQIGRPHVRISEVEERLFAAFGRDLGAGDDGDGGGRTTSTEPMMSGVVVGDGGSSSTTATKTLTRVDDLDQLLATPTNIAQLVDEQKQQRQRQLSGDCSSSDDDGTGDDAGELDVPLGVAVASQPQQVVYQVLGSSTSSADMTDRSSGHLASMSTTAPFLGQTVTVHKQEQQRPWTTTTTAATFNAASHSGSTSADGYHTNNIQLNLQQQQHVIHHQLPLHQNPHHQQHQPLNPHQHQQHQPNHQQQPEPILNGVPSSRELKVQAFDSMLTELRGMTEALHQLVATQASLTQQLSEGLRQQHAEMMVNQQRILELVLALVQRHAD